MTISAKLKREDLITKNGAIINDRYRARIFPIKEIPILSNLKTLIGTEAIVIDLIKAEGLEIESSRRNKYRQKRNDEMHNLEFDKENIPEGCTIGGDPLKVSFLTIEKLEKSIDSYTNYNQPIIIEHSFFKAHLLTSLEAIEFFNEMELEELFVDSLKNITCVVVADATNCNNLLFLARQKTNKFITTTKAMFLGKVKNALNALNLLTLQYQQLNMRHCVCCTKFDVLSNIIIFQRSPDFIPASFLIQAEWSIPMSKTRNLRKIVLFENLFNMPPNNASIIVKFKPGWMDERVLLTNNIYELKQLSNFAIALKEGRLPWNQKDVDDDDGEFLLQRVTELIESARNKPELQNVYPFDFTDRFWDIIRNVRSTDTLKKAFEMIYSELRTGKFRVMIEADKVSSLAKMLRVRTLGNMVFPRLESMTLLQLLVEIGIDRFKSDIQYRFLKDEFISNVMDLQPFFLDSVAHFEDQIEQLMPLYLALQSMLMIEKYVRLSPHKKMIMAKKILTHFTSLKNADFNTKEFSFKASMEDIYQNNLKSSMIEWVMERIYEKNGNYNSHANSNSCCAIHEIVCLSKNIGFEHIQNVILQQNNSLEFQNSFSTQNEFKNKTKSTETTPLLNDSNKKKDNNDVSDSTIEAELDNKETFDCVYLTAVTSGLSGFTQFSDSTSSRSTTSQ